MEAVTHASGDYTYLSKLVKRELSPNQWAAFLSFSYNLGRGNADNLVALINEGEFEGLKYKWLSYNKAGGKVSNVLKNRRQKEVEAFIKDVPL